MAQTESTSDKAVSPVIGVILMVAITVILAAVIAAYVFGMSSSIPITHSVVATAAQIDDTHITVVYKGGPDEKIFSGANVTITPSDAVILAKAAYNPGDPGTLNLGYLTSNVGSMCTASYPVGSRFSGNDHIIVTAWFNDGSSQVILNTYI